MEYRNRDAAYIFTVTNGPTSELFFKQLRKLRPDGVRLFRMGRNRNRQDCGRQRHQGRVPINLSDRWDLYINVDHLLVSRGFSSYPQFRLEKAMEFIRGARHIIQANEWRIRYANKTHKNVFDKIFNQKTADLSKVQISTEAVQMTQSVLNKVMNTTSTWNVALKAEIEVHGETRPDLVRTLKSMGFEEKDIVSAVMVEQHRDLPLIQFSYPKHGDPYNESELRKVRVTKMDAAAIEGFEGNTWKKFLRCKIVGRVDVVEIPSKEK